MNYDKLTELIENTLNGEEKALFELKFVANYENFNPDNLVYDEQVHGVVTLLSRTPNTIQMVDNTSESGITANGTEVYQIQLFAPVEFNNDIEMSSQIDNFLKIWNNQTIDLEDTTFFTTQTSIVSWSKYPTHLNGYDYQLVVIQFTAITFTNFLFGNDRIIKINDIDLDCVVDVSLSSQKMFNTLVKNGEKIAKNQDNGTQWNLIIDLIYNKNSDIHKTLIADWQLLGTYNLKYSIGDLSFIRSNCKMQSYILQDITGDVIKLRLTFAEGGV